MGWKEISKKEVIEFLKKDVPLQILKEYLGKNFLINSSMPREIVCVSNLIYKLFNRIKKKAIQPLFLGEKICDVKTRARLSLPFAKKIAKQMPKVYVNHKAEQLFLYGRDVWKKSVLALIVALVLGVVLLEGGLQ